MRLLAGICAAGDAARMGFDKLTRPLSADLGATTEDCLLGRSLSAVQNFHTCVALPAADHPYFAARARTVGTRAEIVSVRDAHLGLSESLRALAQIAMQNRYDGLLVTLADLPRITSSHVRLLADAFETAAAQVPMQARSLSGHPGHPVIFPAAFLRALSDVPPGQGAKRLLRSNGVQYVPFDDDGPSFDLDTPDAWDAYAGSPSS